MFKMGLVSALFISALGCSHTPAVKAPSSNQITYADLNWDITLPTDFLILDETKEGITAQSTKSDVGIALKHDKADYDFDTYTTVVAFNLVLTEDHVDIKAVSWAGHDSLYTSFIKDDKQYYFWHTVSQGHLYRFGCAGNKNFLTIKSECYNLAATVHIHPTFN